MNEMWPLYKTYLLTCTLSGDIQVLNTFIFLQLSNFWTLSIVLLLFKNDVLETGLCLRPQVKA
jgi:succinate-acetate transporter protein